MKKQIWCLIPTVVFPYLVLCALSIVFFDSNFQVMETVFRGNGWNLVVLLLLFAVLAVGFTIYYCILCISNRWPPLSQAKAAMIIKLIQIPAYLSIFAFGVLLMITPFTLPFTLALFLLDGFTLLLTGLITVSSVICSMRDGLISFGEGILFIILQLIFCADVVAAVLFYAKLNRGRVCCS